MKRTLRNLVVTLSLTLGIAGASLAQSTPVVTILNPATSVPLGTVIQAGILPSVVVFTSDDPTDHTIEWSNTGTAAANCGFKLLGSSDGTHWYDMTGTLSCTANAGLILPISSIGGMTHVIDKAVSQVMVYITVYTPGDSSTLVTFRYTRGQKVDK